MILELIHALTRQQGRLLGLTLLVSAALGLIMAIVALAVDLKNHGRSAVLPGIGRGVELRLLQTRSIGQPWRDSFERTELLALQSRFPTVVPFVQTGLVDRDGRSHSVLVAGPELVAALALRVRPVRRDGGRGVEVWRTSLFRSNEVSLSGQILPITAELADFRGLSRLDVDLVLSADAARLAGLSFTGNRVWRALVVGDSAVHLADIERSLDQLRLENGLPAGAADFRLEPRLGLTATTVARIDTAIASLALIASLLVVLAVPLLIMRIRLQDHVAGPLRTLLHLLGAPVGLRRLDGLIDATVLTALSATMLWVGTALLLAWVRDAFELESKLVRVGAGPLHGLMTALLLGALVLAAMLPRVRWLTSENWQRRIGWSLSATQSAVICVTLAMALAACYSWLSRVPPAVPFELSGLRVIEARGSTCRPESGCLTMGEIERRLHSMLGPAALRIGVSSSTHPLPNLIPFTTRARVDVADFSVEVNYVSANYFAVLDPDHAPLRFATHDAIVDQDFVRLAGLAEPLATQPARVSADTVSLVAVYPYATNATLSSTGDPLLPVLYINKSSEIYGVFYLWLRDLDRSIEQRIMSELVEPLGLRGRAVDASTFEAENLKRERALAALIGFIALASYAILVASASSDLMRRWREQKPTLAACYALGMTRAELYSHLIWPVLSGWLAGALVAALVLPVLYLTLEDVLYTSHMRITLTLLAFSAFALAIALLLLLIWLRFRQSDIGAWLRPAGEAH